MTHICFYSFHWAKKDNRNLSFIPTTDAKDASDTYGFIRILESSNFMGSCLHELVEVLKDETFLVTKKHFADRWEFVEQQMPASCETFKLTNGYYKLLTKLKKEIKFSTAKDEKRKTKNTKKIKIDFLRSEKIFRIFGLTDVTF